METHQQNEVNQAANEYWLQQARQLMSAAGYKEQWKQPSGAAALEARARRAAKRVGLIACKSRWRADTIDNRGGFQLLQANSNWIRWGEKYDLTPEQVIEICEKIDAGEIKL